jgi:hypothetical protein
VRDQGAVIGDNLLDGVVSPNPRNFPLCDFAGLVMQMFVDTVARQIQPQSFSESNDTSSLDWLPCV